MGAPVHGPAQGRERIEVGAVGVVEVADVAAIQFAHGLNVGGLARVSVAKVPQPPRPSDPGPATGTANDVGALAAVLLGQQRTVGHRITQQVGVLAGRAGQGGRQGVAAALEIAGEYVDEALVRDIVFQCGISTNWIGSM